MPEWSQADKSVLHRYARPIGHMRAQLQVHRLSLVFGAGVSEPLGVPSWQKLNQRIAEHDEVDAPDLAQHSSAPVRTQRLFEHFKATNSANVDVAPADVVRLERRLLKQWTDIVRQALYRDVNRGQPVAERHPYLAALLPVIKQSPITVNYNFDDFTEQLLLEGRTEEEKRETRGYETLCRLRPPSRPNRQVIFHPNGFLPGNPMEGGVSLVFTEDEYLDALMAAGRGQHASLVYHFSNNTCLLIGLSLEDVILRLLLRQVARANPGLYHYYVHWLGDEEELSEEEQQAIRHSNFETYNLLTLFLRNEEIASLGRLIADGVGSEEADTAITWLANRPDVSVKLAYRYYVVGAVGAGKSTTTSSFANLITYDEWFEPRRLALGKEPETLGKDEEREIDRWIAEQFSLKNHALCALRCGVAIIDRCPLDPISFTKKEKWSQKADDLLSEVKGASGVIAEGHIILLLNDPAELELRLLTSAKEYSADRLDTMQKDLQEIYSMPGVTLIDARYRTAEDVLKEVARVVYLAEYVPADIGQQLEKVKEGEITCQT